MTEPSAAVPTSPDNASMAEDFVDIFVSPARVFARRAKASPMVPYMVVCILLIVLFFASKNVLAPIFDAQMQKGMAASMKANPQITPEMMEKSKPITNVVINVGGVVGPPIVLLILALITWVIGRFFMSSGLTFGTALLITAYACIPRVLSSILGLVQGLAMDVGKMTSPYQLTLSPARFFDPGAMSDGLYQMLGQLDLFSIWGTVLVVIGLIHAGKLEKNKAIATGVIMFVVGCIPALWALAKGS
jgi:hypothetical protein